MNVSLSDVCGQGVNSFWDIKTQFLTQCAIHLLVDVPVYVLLLVVCAFALGRLSRHRQSFSTSRISIIPRKSICAIQILILSSIVVTSLIYVLQIDKVTPASAISITVQVFSSCVFAWNVIRVLKFKCEIAPSTTTFALFLVFTTSFSHLYYAIIKRQTWSDTTVILSATLVTLKSFLTVTQFFKSIPSAHILRDDEIHESLITSNIEFQGEEHSSIVSKLCFSWVSPLVDRGLQIGALQFHHLFALPESLTSMHVSSQNDDQPSQKKLWKLLVFRFKKDLTIAALLKLVSDISSFFKPVLLNRLLLFLESDERDVQTGFIVAALLFLSISFSSIVNCQFNFMLGKTTLKMKSYLIQVVYRKLLKTKEDQFNDGQVINFVTSDCDRIANWCPSLMAFFSCPLQLIIAMILLHGQIGISFLAGLAVAVVILPINKWTCTKIGEFTKKMMEAKDERLRIMSEIFRGIRQIKMNVWENYFEDKIEKIRSREVKFLKYRKYLDAVCVYFWATTPVIVAVAAFSTYILTGHQLLSSTVFTSLALFNMMMMPLNAFPWILNGLVEAKVSADRLQKYVDSKDISGKKVLPLQASKDVIVLNEAIFRISPSFYLGPLNLTIRKGSLVGVIGKVASGKSSFLKSLLGEFELNKGSALLQLENPDSGIGFLPQDPWIQNASIRNNILFGKNYDFTKYQMVLEFCAMNVDIKQMNQGDATVVGDRGSRLSGGQRTRLALARECYQDYEMYLMDDPFSSLDSVTSGKVCNCITNVLDTKTRIIVTQNQKCLKQCDLIIEFESGQISRVGTADEFFQDLALSTDESTVSNDSDHVENVTEVDDELREEGLVKLSVLTKYIQAVGWPLCITVFASVIGMQVSRSGSDLWLAHWSSHPNSSQVENLEIYAAIGVANSFASIFRAGIFALAGIMAAIRVHEALFSKVMTATLNFFDTTPTGRTLNRFSNDVWNVDDALPFTLNIFLAQSSGLAASIILTIYGLPVTLVLFLLLVIPYFKLQNIYRWTSRDLKRLSSTTAAPILTLISETLDGRSVVRAANCGKRFIEELCNKVDTNNCCNYSSSAAAEWLDLRLQAIGVSVTTLVAFLAVGLHIWMTGYLNAGLIGLALTYSLSLTSQLNGTFQSFTQLETDFVSVERINQVLEVVQSEREDEYEELYEWPTAGKISICNLSVKYNEDFAIRDLNLEIEPFQFVGIVGRTGSGKSTLLKTLFDLVPHCNGTIKVDEVPIDQLPLKTLRKGISCIPQEPFLFEGTIRENLDPSGSLEDEILWKAIHEVKLSSIKSLDNQVTSNSFSGGQMQLLCLARVLLSNPKIVCLDEATAHVDPETEKLLMDTLEDKFRCTTVLMIAHKLESVKRCDFVVVMEQGRIVEQGPPLQLMEDKESVFSKLWIESQETK